MQPGNAPADLVDRLAAHRTLAGLPRTELQWLAIRGQFLRAESGAVLSNTDTPIRMLYILLSGRIAMRIEASGAPSRRIEWEAGDVTGTLPYSRLTTPPGATMVLEPIEALTLDRDQFPDLIHACPETTTRLVHSMLDRARYFRSAEFLDERLRSLGKLSAGLAHELNNPASAVARSASMLATAIEETAEASRALGAAGLVEQDFAGLAKVLARCRPPDGALRRTAMDEADREEAFHAWLTARGLPADSAGMLARSALELADLESVAVALDAGAQGAMIRWLATRCATRELVMELETAAGRIRDLVSAVKGFTHVGETTPRPVDVGRGLSDTLAVLAGEARARKVALSLEVEPGLTAITGHAGALNQVWANLVENALDATGPGGHVAVTARREGDAVMVSVTDDGSGIPDEVMSRIFDPFYTTKSVGQGTGLGLDIVRRLVDEHRGDIKVSSRPGETVFRVILPAVDRPLHEEGR
jgi:signal transduction histidine kinase